MTEPAERGETRDERIDRLLAAVEQLVQDNRRERARKDDAAARAARKVGPTTDAARAHVAALHKKWRGEK